MGGLTDERPLAPCQRNTEVARWGVYKRLVKASPNKLKLGDILAVIREHEVAAYLESDADLLREYLGEQRGGLKVVKA